MNKTKNLEIKEMLDGIFTYARLEEEWAKCGRQGSAVTFYRKYDPVVREPYTGFYEKHILKSLQRFGEYTMDNTDITLFLFEGDIAVNMNNGPDYLDSTFLISQDELGTFLSENIIGKEKRKEEKVLVCTPLYDKQRYNPKADEIYRAMKAYSNKRGIPFVIAGNDKTFREEPSTLGYYRTPPARGKVNKKGEIVLRDDIDAKAKCAVAAHEITHSMIHGKGKESQKDVFVRELQANAIAYLVCDYLGLSTKDFSFSQMSHALEKGERACVETLVYDIDIIHKTAKEISEGIGKEMSHRNKVHDFGYVR